MSKIPEDSMLRRHYLTEQRYREESKTNEEFSKFHVYLTGAFIFLLVVLFL